MATDTTTEIAGSDWDMSKIVQLIGQTTAAVDGLAKAVEKQGQHIERNAQAIDGLSIRQARREGVSVPHLLTTLGVLASWTALFGYIASFYVEGKLSPLINASERLHEDVSSHISTGAHPEADRRIAVHENLISAVQIENETQHRWMADVQNLQNDFNYRMAQARVDESGKLIVPPPNYVPLHTVGTVKHGE